MIGSLMSRMGDAQKLSVEQLHKAVSDGTLPAYVGIPLIQDKMQQQKMAMAQQPQKQPPIAEQIMQESAQRMPRRMEEEPQGIESAPSNLPTQMAKGGILGFAVGGMDDDEEDRELAELYGSGTDNDLIQAIAAAGGGRRPHPSAAIEMKPESGSIGFGKGHKYHDAVVKEAERQGLDPNIALHALYKETGNLKDPETARSKAGAIGVMQLMPRTAKSLGVDPTDPMQNIQGGVGYLKQMYDKYQDPRLTLMAYNAGPGNVDKALRSERGIAALPAETRHYVNMAQGGVAHFDGQGPSLVEAREQREAALKALNTGMPDVPADYRGSLTEYLSDPDRAAAYEKNQKEREIARKAILYNNPLPSLNRDVLNPAVSMKNNPVIEPSAGVPTLLPSAAKEQQQDVDASSKYAMPTPPAPVAPAVTPNSNAGINALPSSPPTSDPMLAQYLKQIGESRAEVKKDAETNKYLALMQAGFGMMGGTSPYAAANIGQGAMQGVGTYAQLAKSTAEQKRDLMNQELGLYKYSSAADIAKSRLAQDKSYHQALLGQGEQKQALALAAGREDKYRKQFFIEGMPPTQKQQDAFNDALRKDKTYQRLIKEAGYGDMEDESPKSTTSSGGWSIKPKG